MCEHVCVCVSACACVFVERDSRVYIQWAHVYSFSLYIIFIHVACVYITHTHNICLVCIKCVCTYVLYIHVQLTCMYTYTVYTHMSVYIQCVDIHFVCGMYINSIQSTCIHTGYMDIYIACVHIICLCVLGCNASRDLEVYLKMIQKTFIIQCVCMCVQNLETCLPAQEREEPPKEKKNAGELGRKTIQRNLTKTKQPFQDGYLKRIHF